MITTTTYTVLSAKMGFLKSSVVFAPQGLTRPRSPRMSSQHLYRLRPLGTYSSLQPSAESATLMLQNDRRGQKADDCTGQPVPSCRLLPLVHSVPEHYTARDTTQDFVHTFWLERNKRCYETSSHFARDYRELIWKGKILQRNSLTSMSEKTVLGTTLILRVEILQHCTAASFSLAP